MSATIPKSAEEIENLLSKVFEILDSYDFDRFGEVFATELSYEGGLRQDKGLDNFTKSLKHTLANMPAVKSSHSRYWNEITASGTIYSLGYSTAEYDTAPGKSVTVPAAGVFSLVQDGPEKGKIRTMKIYKDRLPFLPYNPSLPGQKKT